MAGAACWVLTVVFFVAQAVAQAASRAPYSLTANYISDLGNTACGPFTVGAYHADVCSPLHGVMNAAFVVSGLLTVLGAAGTWPAWPRRRLRAWGLSLVALAGAGQVVVGFEPENVNIGLHGLGALFGIAGMNVGVLLLGITLWRVRWWAGALSVLVGAVGVASFVLLGTPAGTALGVGLVERVAGYPMVLWIIAVGAFLLRSAGNRA